MNILQKSKLPRETIGKAYVAICKYLQSRKGGAGKNGAQSNGKQPNLSDLDVREGNMPHKP